MNSPDRSGERSIASRRIGLADGSGRLRALLGDALAQWGPVAELDAEHPDGWQAELVVWAANTADADFAGRALDWAAQDGRRLVVAVPADAIDAWGGAIAHAGVELVTDDDPEGLIRAAARRPDRGAALAREGAQDDAAHRLHELSLEVERIAQALGALGEGRGVADRRPPYRGGPGTGAPMSAAQIRAMIRARRLRDQYFAAGLFADPAWDMLLDLMAARLEGREVAVSSLCIAAAVPPTTALRWIGMMTEQGLLLRVADPADRRRVFLRLSDDAAERMDACLRALAPVAAVA